MKAQFVGRTLVITPESDGDKEQLKYYGGPSDNPSLWECFGWEEDTGSWSAQGLCPVGLQAHEILNRFRFLTELNEVPLPSPDDKEAFYKRVYDDMELLEKIEVLLGADSASH